MDDAVKQKRMKVMLISVGILFGAIFLYKIVMGLILKHMMANMSHEVTVSTTVAKAQEWQSTKSASGSLRAIRGVSVTTELAGMVQTIYFTPGAFVEKGDVLVQLNADNDIALLHSLEANEELAEVTYRRDKAQYAAEAISRQVLDTDAANVKSLKAQVDQQAAIVQKKTIVAPFRGRLGINQINPGQYLNAGDPIVMLQTLDPIYADFYVPQQALSKIKVGMLVNVKMDAYPKKVFTGKITTVNPAIDDATRNVEMEATIANPTNELAPGMFVTVEAVTGKNEKYITVPQTVIVFNSYGEIVYIVEEASTDWKGKHHYIVRQSFVKTGERRGNEVAVLSGIKEGDVVVTSGQIKLKNKSAVVIDNSHKENVVPMPELTNDHDA